MITQSKTVVKIKDFSQPSFFVIIVKDKKEKSLLGALSSEWVCDAVKSYSSIVVERDKEDSIELAKKFLTNSTYTVVVSGNTPLLTSDVFNHLVEYATIKEVKACKFMGGGVFNTQYLKSSKNIFYDSVYMQNDEAFYIVENAKQLAYAIEVLKNRIVDYHMSNGVTFNDVKSIYIEKDVVLGRGVVVNARNTIKGCTIIEDACIIKENNIIENCRIGKYTCVASSNIVDTIIGKDCIIMPYSNINSCHIGNNVVVFGNMSLVNKNITDNKKIKNKEVNK